MIAPNETRLSSVSAQVITGEPARNLPLLASDGKLQQPDDRPKEIFHDATSFS
jgi:hypothetical protein